MPTRVKELVHEVNYFSDISSSSGGALGPAPINSGGPSVPLCADEVFLLDFTCGMKTDRKSAMFTPLQGKKNNRLGFGTEKKVPRTHLPDEQQRGSDDGDEKEGIETPLQDLRKDPLIQEACR